MNLRQIIIVFSGLTIIGVSYFLMKTFGKQKTKSKPRKALKTVKEVKVMPVTYSDIESEIVLFGRVTSSSPSEIVAEVPGVLKKGDVPLKEGQSFTKGQVLFRIDKREASLAVQSLKSSFLKNLAAILPDLKVDFPNVFEKWKAYFQTIDIDKPLQELPKADSQKEKIFLATKDIFKGYYDIKQKEVNLEKYAVRAIFSGTFVSIAAHEGSFTSVGKEVAKIIETSNLDLKVSVPIQDIKWIRLGTQVNIEEESTGHQWKGRISRIGKIVNQNTQSIDVFAAVQNTTYPIYEGMYLKVIIPTVIFKQALEINRSAIFNNNQVYVVENDSILKVKMITLLKINPETVIISGLDTIYNLVSDPLLNAYEGMIVSTKTKS